jgi:hypothetical protein
VPPKRPLLVLLCLLTLAPPAGAHNLSFTDGVLLIRSDGRWQLDLVCDLDALALGAPPGADSAALAEAVRGLAPQARDQTVERLRQMFQRRVRVLFDGDPVAYQVAFPHAGTPLADAATGPSELGLVARLEGRTPVAASTVAVRLSRAFPPLALTVLYQSEHTGVRLLGERGAASEAVPLHPEPAQPDALAVAGRYLVLGFWHIVPAGLDHILFVLGLYLLSPRLGPLLWQVSAFTVAHTLTLALAVQGVVRLPASVVEPLIALSIAWVAIENVVTTELKPWRPALVFAFGLLHGLGFAGVLAELGLPSGELVTGLLAFNLGVELGQLSVIVAAFATLGRLRHRPDYRRRVTIPASLLIAATGVYWAVERTLL